MPLKESDLKDAESYKKASRQDLSKLASGNTKFWIYKDVELPAAGGRKQKYPAFLALVDDNGIRKWMTGKKLLCKGTCGMKDQGIAFEPSTGAVPYKVLKVSVPLLLGKPVLIPTGREEEEGEADDAEDAPPVAAQAAAAPTAPAPPKPPAAPQQPPAAPALTAASLTGAWSKLTKDVQAYVTAHPEGKADLFRDMSAIGVLLKANKAAEAKTKMDQMQATLAAPPPAPPANASGPADAAGAARAAARWGGIQKQLQAAVAANPERRPELVKATAGLADLIRGGKFDAAAKQMDAIELALKENPKEKEYHARYQAVEGRLREALKDPARDGSGLRAMSAFIVEKGKAGDFEAALKALQRLEESLAAKPKPAAETGGSRVREAVKEVEREEAEEEEEEDEESKAEAAELQKDLKGRMIAAMRQVKAREPHAGDTPKPQMQFIVYVAGAMTSVIVARKVGSPMKKLLAEIAGAAGGKMLRGECLFEANAYTFVLENAPGGLAKKLTKALLAETAIRYKVRVRAADGSGVLDDETDVDPDEAGSSQESTGTGIPPKIVAKRKFLIERWQKIRPEVKANLKSLKDAIAREMPSENAEELIGLSEKYLDEFYDEMKEALDDDINSGDGQYKNAIASIHDFRKEIASEPLIQHLKANPLGASIDVESILLSALSEVEKNLAS